MKRIIALGVAAAFTAPLGAQAADAALYAKYNCSACHSPDKQLVGPSYDAVAKKYKGDASAQAKLEAKVKAGGAGVWGAMPMPPNNVPDADLKSLVAGILARA
jgi:cytochrome c